LRKYFHNSEPTSLYLENKDIANLAISRGGYETQMRNKYKILKFPIQMLYVVYNHTCISVYVGICMAGNEEFTTWMQTNTEL
jgi:hypothetical protein